MAAQPSHRHSASPVHPRSAALLLLLSAALLTPGCAAANRDGGGGALAAAADLLQPTGRQGVRVAGRRALLGANESAQLIVLLKEQQHLEALRPGGRCDVAALPSNPHIFSSAVWGVAGKFTGRQLAAMRGCLPQGAVKLVEEDQSVQKAEGPSYGAWWEAQVPSSVSSAPSTANPTAPQQQQPAPGGDRAGPTAAQLFELVSIGLSAQAAISKLLKTLPAANRTAAPLPPPVQRADSATAAATVGVTGSSAATPPGAAADLAIAAVAAVFDVTSSASSTAKGVGRALWNLDRMDQRALPLDGQYDPPATGEGVTVYTIDSGANTKHQEFGGGAGGRSRASLGPDFIDKNKGDALGPHNDCDGHGSHVASTAVGRAVGVASGASVVAVRVLDCEGSGAISDVVAALDWVASSARRPAVVTLSLGVPAGNWSSALEEAVRSVIVKSGIPVVVAAGNNKVDACTIAPASVDEAITVAASNIPSKFLAPARAGTDETLYSWGNSGPCVDVLAPGVDIFAACASDARCGHATDETYTWASGTSMAVPHVAGWAALFLQRHPTATPAEVKAALVSTGTLGMVTFGPGAFPGTPDLLAFTGGAVDGGGGGRGGVAPATAAFSRGGQLLSGVIGW